jgi:dihydroneopterin aldolase
MKKKIINGILLVAMLFAATTSFVSCKDNVDDEILPVYAQLTQTKNDLSTRISSLEGQIASLQSELNNTKADVTTIKGQIAELQSDVNDLKSRLAAVESQIATLSADVDNIKNDMQAIDARLTLVEAVTDKIAEFLAKGMVTEIAVNQTVNDAIGTINLPGVNVKMLAALFGDNQTYIEKFPVAGKDYNVDPDGGYLDASDIAGAKFIELNEDYITKPNGNAGKFFFTANSMDKSTFNIKDWTLTLEDSKGTVAPVYFENVQPSEYPIQWGIYKSDVLGSNEAETDLGFYEADATIDAEYLEKCKFNLRNHVDYKAIKDEIKQAVENVKAAKGTQATVISVAKEAVKLVENIFSGNMSGDNRFPENPTYSPQRLVMTQAVDESYVRFQDADLDVMLTAVSPLSYNTFWTMEKNAKGINMDLVDRIAAKLAKIINKAMPTIELGKITLTIPDIDSPAENEAYILVGPSTINPADPTTYTKVKIEDNIFKEIKDAIQEGVTDIDLSEAVNNTAGGSLANMGDKVADRFSSFVERLSNKYVAAMKKHALTRAVAPIILYDTTDGIKRLVPGTTVNAGYMVINMTSATKERIVPPYEKYIAVKDASGKIIYSATVPGNNQLQTLDLTKAGDYTIILSCMDYYGYVVTKKYDITVK